MPDNENPNFEKMDPVDDFIKYWDSKIEEIKQTPIPLERRHIYFQEFLDSRVSFEQSSNYHRSKYYNSGYNIIYDKLNRVETSLALAIEQGIAKYNEQQNKHKIEELKNKKGLFENAKVTLLKIKGKLF
jgi:hypothetical protein